MALLTPHGHRSPTEYCFSVEEADAIIRVTAYNRTVYCYGAIWFSSRDHAGVRSSIATPFLRASNTGLGTLNRLPLELLHDVFLRMGMRSIFKFRQVNLRSRQMVDSLKQYQVVASHGLDLLCLLLRTRPARDVSLSDFYDAMNTKICASCGKFAGFMSLSTWSRCCPTCLQSDFRARMQTLAAAQALAARRDRKAREKQAKSRKIPPRTYSMKECLHEFRVADVSVHQAASAAGRHSHVPAAEAQRTASWYRKREVSIQDACALPYYDKRIGTVEHGISCTGCKRAPLNSGFMARDRLYPRDGFLEHFRSCEQAQLLWTSSGGGSKHQGTQVQR